jgi:ribosomal protein S18 acetylase RimI-like enzyme
MDVIHDFFLRPARLEDAESLWRNCFSQDTLDATREYLAWCLKQTERGRVVRLVAEVGGETVANAQLTLWPGQAEIGSLVVAEEHRRQGIAAALVVALTEAARQMGVRRLEIGARASEPGLIALYRRWGFAPYQKIEPPRLSGDDCAIYMIKDLALPDQGEFYLGGEGLESGPNGPDLSFQF